MTGPDEEPEPSKGGDYPIDDLEREAAGLPPLTSDRRDKPNPPQLVQLSVTLWLAATLMLIAGFVLLIINADEIAVRLVEVHEQEIRSGQVPKNSIPVSPEQIRAQAPGTVLFLSVGGMMMAALIVLFAYKAREGTRSTRTVLAALTATFALYVVFMHSAFVNAVLVAAVVVACVALVLMFLPSVSYYFPKLPRTTKRWRDYT